MPRALLLTLSLPILCAGGLAGQQTADRFDGAGYDPPALADVATAPVAALPTASRVPSSVPAGSETAESAGEGRSFLSAALHTMGGALVGGWVGYVGSQVALSDWEKTHNGAFNSERGAWVAGGMVVGILGSRLFDRTKAPTRPAIEVRRPRSDRNILDRATIIGSGTPSVYDLVVTLRKDWLVTRGTNSIRESPRGSASGFGSAARVNVTPGTETVMVYLDNIRLGGVDEMQKILTADIMEIEFIEPQEAVYRYGAGHTHGVILLKTSI